MTQTPELPHPRVGAPDAALDGAPAARRLVREIAADPAGSRRVDVVGPGGHGKSTLLEIVARTYESAGISVLRNLPAVGETLDHGTALVVDDAHLLGAAELDRLAKIGTESAGPLIIAHRPWPYSPALAVLGAVLASEHPPVVLEALDTAGVAARAARVLRERPTAELVDYVRAQTHGVPGLVDRLLTALLGLAPRGGPMLLPPPDGIPPGLLAQLSYTLQSIDVGVRDLLLARAVGAPLDGEVLLALLGPDAHAGAASAVDDLIEAGRAMGLLAADGRPIPLVSAAVLAGTSAARVLELRKSLAEIELDRGGDVLAAARGLLGTGATGSRVATVFLAAAEDAVRTGSAGAIDLYDAAVSAGAAAPELAGRRAEAAMLAGDIDQAMSRADQALSAPDLLPSGEIQRAGMVAAAVLARRGLLARSAELYRWMNHAAPGSESLLAVPALIGTGALAEAREILHRTTSPPTVPGVPPRPPTLLAGAEELMAQGIVESVEGSPTAALSSLARAAAMLESSNHAALLPDTPAALAALVGVHCGEFSVARSVLEAAVAADLGGRATASRHRLLQAWIATCLGATARARGLLAEVHDGRGLEPRDELFAAALEVALARRATDLAALTTGWSRAREAIVRHPVDLYSLQPLGELLVGAARLREQSWVGPHLAEAWALLERLGTPALWAAPLHWSCLQAAIAGGSGDDGVRHAAALDAISASSRYATAMAAAGRAWLRILGGDVDAAFVEEAARGLHAVGLTWEAGRLAGQAAIRTRNRKDMSALLGCARAMQGGGAGTAGAVSTPAPGTGPRPDGDANGAQSDSLSDREREVAELVLTGMTYKQIGEQLFISAKTVEHHVARIRQRLGSGSRGELFAQLRMVVGKS